MMATCNWQEEDYFSMLMHADKKSHVALEMLVDDLHADKERTIHKFLGHSGAEDFLWGLVKLLGSDIPRVAGNSAYIIGTIAETEMGCHRILGLAKGEHSESRKILPDLTRMLTFDDAESVMNAAGTMGTLAEGYEGREWILEEPCLNETLEHVTALLQAENLWTASNAALVLARLSISENGCNKILDHENSQHILSRLVQSLGVDEAGRGMNAAFAIGRLCDIEIGRKRLLSLPDSERMLSSLAKMLCCDDTGASKNACFALSCLATNVEGHTRLLNNIHSDDILRTLSSLLNASDSETGWFAAMTLRTLASQPRGCLRLREHPQVVPSLKAVDKKSDANPDLKEEVGITLEILKKLEKPLPPVIEVIGSDRILAKWEAVSSKSGFQVRYQLFDLTKCVYTGKDTSCEVGNLSPCSQYTYKVRAYTEGDESPFSDTVTIVTEESVPSPPQNLRVLGSTITQLKVGWDPPDQVNGALKGYYVFQGEKLLEHTSEHTAIITGLQASTSYEIEVCAATVKGKGQKACVVGTTSDIGAHAPSKPHVQVLGRNELHITWDSPEVPLGRITRYDLLMNGKIIYSGTDLSYTVRRLTPDTEYSFVVLALTSEGKFDSKVTKKKTAKDEYDSSRPPLYQPPPSRDSIGEEVKTTNIQKKKRQSLTNNDIKSRPVSSAKNRSITPVKDKNKPPGEQAQILRPTSETDPEKFNGSFTKSFNTSTPATSSIASSHVTTEREAKEINGEVVNREPMKNISENKPESLRPKSKSRSTPVQNVQFRESSLYQPKQVHKPEREKTSINKMFPVPVSYVSIQGEKSGEDGGDSNENDTDKKIPFHRSGTFISHHLPHGMKPDRSKTMLHSGNRGRGRGYGRLMDYNSNTTNQNYINSIIGKNNTDASALLDSNDFITTPMGYERPHQTKGGSIRPIVNDLPAQKRSSKSKSTTASQALHRANSAEQPARQNGEPVKSSKSSHSEKTKSTVLKDANLPKPMPPSQQYLEGGGQAGNSNTPWGSRSLPSPRTLARQKQESENDTKDHDVIIKRLIEQQRNKKGYLMPAGHPNDCSYFLEAQQEYLHRSNNYMKVHRKQYEKEDSKGGRVTFPSLTKNTRRRSAGDRGKAKSARVCSRSGRPGKRVQPSRSTSTESDSIPQMPLVGNYTQTFSLDLPENKSTMTTWNRTFIPMQLRTQPSNLPASQLQRVNSTLGEQAKGIQFKRVEALTRSQTLIDIKSSQNAAMTLAEQVEKYPVSHSASARERHNGVVRSKGNNLMKSPSARHREPDSLLLQQSWSLSASHELQSAR